MIPVGTNNRQTLAYFTDSTPVSLGVGDVLSVNFTFQIQAIPEPPTQTPQVFRIGLFNSGGQRVSSDGTGLSNGLFADYTGYASFVRTIAPVDSPNSPMAITKRNQTNNTLINSQDAYSFLAQGGQNGNTFASSTTYTGELTVSRTAESSVSVSIAFTGGSLAGYSHSIVDTTSPYYAFDTLTFYGSVAAFESLTLNSVNVSVVPEPAAAMLLGISAIVVCLLAGRRFRKTAR